MSEDGDRELPQLGRAPAERLAAAVVPAGGLAWTAAEIMHMTGCPGVPVLAGGAVIVTALAWGAGGRRDGFPPGLWRWTAVTGGWLAAASAAGPLAWWPAPVLTAAWAVITVAASRAAHRHDAVVSAREWRDARAGWLARRSAWGLGGSHLLDFEVTRLGERYTVSVKGTGKRASQIASSGIAELIAENLDLPVSRVEVTRHRLAGRIIISIRYADPWARPAFHPAVAEDHEIGLPAARTVRDPAPVGQDPETGAVLAVPLWDEAGGKNVSVVSVKGGGKGVLLDSISEHVTACADAVQVRLNLSFKGDAEAESWGPSCHLTAFGEDQAARAARVLRIVGQVIRWRSRTYKRGVFAPSPADPLIVVIVDEADSAMSYPAVRKGIDDIATKGREYGVSLVRAGQRGTTDYGSAKTRSQDDVFCLGKVNRAGEAYHAAGNTGFSLPDMAEYGEGRPGAWAIAELGGGHVKGRTWVFGETPARHGAEIEAIAQDRAFAQPELPAACREFLGEDYEQLLATEVFARWARERDGDGPAGSPGDDASTSSAPPARAARAERQQAAPGAAEAPGGGVALAEDDYFKREDWDMSEDDRAALAALDAKLGSVRAMIEETAAMPRPPEVSPEALAGSTAGRWRQAGEQAQIPDGAREVLLGLLGQGTTIRAVAEACEVTRWTARTWLEKLRGEGLARVDGVKKAARWRLAGDAAI